jgi:hypothetical protein
VKTEVKAVRTPAAPLAGNDILERRNTVAPAKHSYGSAEHGLTGPVIMPVEPVHALLATAATVNPTATTS